MRYTFLLPDENATLALGEKIAQNLKGGAFIALQGGLGAGKTVLVKGLAHGLNYAARNEPYFSYYVPIFRYQGAMPF